MNDQPVPTELFLGAAILLGIVALTMLLLVFNYGQLWFQAYWSKARVTFLELVGMSLRKVNARTIVQARIMATQAGLGTDITSRRLEAHYLAGGDVPRVIRALIAGGILVREPEGAAWHATRTVTTLPASASPLRGAPRPASCCAARPSVPSKVPPTPAACARRAASSS